LGYKRELRAVGPRLFTVLELCFIQFRRDGSIYYRS
jgi:hypothetical protein